MTTRDEINSIIEAALSARRADFAQIIAKEWLGSWPGDIQIQLLLAQAEMETGSFETVQARLMEIISINPEQAEAYDLLSTLLRTTGQLEQATEYESCALLLTGGSLEQGKHPGWVHQLQITNAAMAQGDHKTAVAQSAEALSSDKDFPLPMTIAMQAQLKAGNRSSGIALAQAGQDRWPNCVPFLLVVADDLFEQGSISRAVEYMHRAARFDPDERLAKYYLGTDHPYRSLWPSEVSIPDTRPLPAEVAAFLGTNRLILSKMPESPAAPTTSPDEEINSSEESVTPSNDLQAPQPVAMDEKTELPLPEPEPWESFQGPNPDPVPEDMSRDPEQETILEIQEEIRRMTARFGARRASRDEDGRSRAYVVMTSRSRLMQVYSPEFFDAIDDAVIELVEAVRRRPGWSAYRFYPDDPETLNPFKLSPVDPGNAWQIKHRLADLDRVLGERGEMIAALFIVGGPEIIPFHLLPNPTEDDDEVIPSDNPYATADENYFAPEWSVGRLPIFGSFEQVVAYLKAATRQHSLSIQTLHLWTRFCNWFGTRFRNIAYRPTQAVGYSASIWRKASAAVYKSIGEPGKMITSPPTDASRLPPVIFKPVNLSYYNLHGLEDAPEWYGQRDPNKDVDVQLEFPIALRPEDVINSGRAPKIVFTEACYGANILGKTAQDAICLKFLDSGSRAIIGSTKISYGSVTPPLIAADLLGRLFWVNINQRLPVGEALRRAKLKMAAEMHKRQGFLDGEDQKTLISFVLYGEPLYFAHHAYAIPGEKTVIRRRTRPQGMKTACAKGGCEEHTEELPPETMAHIDRVVKQYLPGMSDAQCRIHPQSVRCEGDDHSCPTHQLGTKSAFGTSHTTTVVTLSKQISTGNRRHPHFARLTLDPNGKVMKLAVSR